MGRVKTQLYDEEGNPIEGRHPERGEYPYYVERYDKDQKKWIAEVRYYMVPQNVEDYPDNKTRRSFKPLFDEKQGDE
jgi:hypothetical protein